MESAEEEVRLTWCEHVALVLEDAARRTGQEDRRAPAHGVYDDVAEVADYLAPRRRADARSRINEV